MRETFIVLSQQPGGLCHFGLLKDIADIAAIAEIRLPPCRLKNRGQLFLRLIVQVQALLLGRQRRNAASLRNEYRKSSGIKRGHRLGIITDTTKEDLEAQRESLKGSIAQLQLERRSFSKEEIVE